MRRSSRFGEVLRACLFELCAQGLEAVDDALVSLHSCCEAISEACLWSNVALLSWALFLWKKNGWVGACCGLVGHRAMLSAFLGTQCHDLSLSMSVGCLVSCGLLNVCACVSGCL